MTTSLPRRALLLATVLCTLMPAAASRTLAQPAPLAGLDAYIENAMKQWQVPGLAVAIVRNDSVIHERGYGVRALGRPEPVDEHTLFAIASTTKAMTVAALGMLVDERRLRWDDPVSRWLPSFQLSDPYITRELTVRDLITHRSGISRSDNLWIAGPFDRAEVLRRARFLPVVESFRSTYGYHNVMYIAAGEVVAAVSDTSWDDFLARRLFAPLGMTRTTTRTDVVLKRDNVALPHVHVNDRIEASTLRNYDNIGGAGAAFSSVHDMAQWIRLHLGGGTRGGKRLLSEAALREMYTPHTIIRSDTVAERLFPATHFRNYALGWNVQDYHGRRLIHHAGALNWTRTQVGMVPSEGIGVVVIANLTSSNLQLAVMYRVLDALLGLPATDWSAEYLTLAQRATDRSTAQTAETERNRAQDTRPSLALADYAGNYASELYGDAVIEQENGRLVLRYAPEYIGDLEHWHHDTFRVVWRRHGFGRGFITFSLNHAGRTAALELEGFGTFRRTGR